LNRSVLAKVGTAKPRAAAAVQQNSPPYEGGVAAAATDGVVLSVGSQVITTFGNVGTIEKMDKETAEVLVGGMRLRQKLTDLQAVAHQTETRPVGRVSNQLSKPIDSPDVFAELNLIGKTTAEADYELDRFIDEVYMASLPRVRIIHGFGTGALKNFVHHFLKNHDLVERFAFASSDQGGNGATIAEIKQ
jgi:DNA mismatch repair protein MutS2